MQKLKRKSKIRAGSLVLLAARGGVTVLKFSASGWQQSRGNIGEIRPCVPQHQLVFLLGYRQDALKSLIPQRLKVIVFFLQLGYFNPGRKVMSKHFI